MTPPPDLSAFVAAEQPRLVRALTLILDDRMVAEEIVQEALIRAASRWERVSQMDSPGGWVHRVAVNLATSQLRRRRLERRVRDRLAGQRTEPRTEDRAAAVAVRAALDALSLPQRRVLVLAHVLEWTAAEIAAVEGGTEAAVRQRLHRARGALRARLDAPTSPDPAPEASDAR